MAFAGQPAFDGVQVIRNIAKPRMSTYSFEVLAVAIVNVNGTSLVTG